MAKGKAATPAEINQISALFNTGRYVELENQARLLVERYPGSGDFWKVLGISLQAQGKGTMDVLHVVEKAAELLPDDAEAHYNLGIALQGVKRHADAVASYRRALRIKPDYAMAQNNLGIALHTLGRLDDAVAIYRRVLETKPDYVMAYDNLERALKSLGRIYDAVPIYRRVLEINPDIAIARSNLIFILDMAADVDIPALYEERKKWHDIHAAHLRQHHLYSNNPDPERRLRIGYVSADVGSTSAPATFGPMLMNFDRTRFDVIFYSNAPKSNFTVRTDYFRQNVTCWRDIFSLPDDAVSDLIRQDEIDILVDLSGHSQGNRLLVFARKPAPIQITALGYPTGTGMKAMDVLFSDPVVLPPDEKQYYAEQVRYLPHFLSYTPPHPPPAVNELPALSAKGVTFGSFNRLEKISEAAYRTWAQVLLTIPDSKMILKIHELSEAKTRESVIGHFTRAGVAPERITLLGGTAWHDHMATYNQVDITLDPFPLGGGITTMEGLMMGVPVVTLRWPTFAGRVGASILTTLGLTDWIAETPEQYIEIARQKADNLAALAELRQQMRNIFSLSTICDQAVYVTHMEQEYRRLWQEWCAGQKAASSECCVARQGQIKL